MEQEIENPMVIDGIWDDHERPESIEEAERRWEAFFEEWEE